MIWDFSGCAFGKTNRAAVGIGAMQDTGIVHRKAMLRDCACRVDMARIERGIDLSPSTR